MKRMKEMIIRQIHISVKERQELIVSVIPAVTARTKSIIRELKIDSTTRPHNKTFYI